MEDGLHHLDCSCEGSAACECSTFSIAGSASVADEVEEKQMMLNDTQQLQALWQTHGSHDGQVACTCAMGIDSCQCEHNATSLNETVAASLKELEKKLSSWWAGHDGQVGAYGHWRAGGVRVGGVKAGGYGGVRYGGVHAGGVHYGGYRGGGYRGGGGYYGGGVRCRGARYGGCGCRYYGCACGGVRAGRCVAR